MTEEETQAAAYLKLQDDVKKLIVDTVYKELMNYGSPMHSQIAARLLHHQDFKDRVKGIIVEQMQKY